MNQENLENVGLIHESAERIEALLPQMDRLRPGVVDLIRDRLADMANQMDELANDLEELLQAPPPPPLPNGNGINGNHAH